ncbi:zinc finger matrin-type protein 4 isoform X2 [Petromyzon marinus]|uniref:Zinc finger matrin-type protein 4-like isoform X2 n=1 Tax=Petromyzon marinus TaxID=7757 RepID=A0AAJ7T069_PETMA|nr:zinc finger matrin-type protein 4-like isoform X2 [Petromyzon marinus]
MPLSPANTSGGGGGVDNNNKMKPELELDGVLFTETFCKVCSAKLISESQRLAHYQSRKHANKVRMHSMLNPEDGGSLPKMVRTEVPGGTEDSTDVERMKACTLCSMVFNSAVVAQAHYQGKTHAKKLKLMLGTEDATATVSPASKRVVIPPSGAANPSPVEDAALVNASPLAGSDPQKLCRLCNAFFNNPGMAAQHYEGKKHRKNAARAQTLGEPASGVTNPTPAPAKTTYVCDLCNVNLNSMDQYQNHLKGNKHQNKLKQTSAIRPVSSDTTAEGKDEEWKPETSEEAFAEEPTPGMDPEWL